MINTLTLGSHTYPINLIQGPLAGISCAPFRRLTWEYSKPAFSCTEMISCKTLIHQSKANHRYIKKSINEGPVCFQLSANQPNTLGEAVKIVTDFGADLIDLNCGCPVNKIRSKGAGSKLLTQPGLVYQLVTAMKCNTHVPVSIKIRVDGTSTDSYNQDMVNAVSDAGADYINVHGRHWTDDYSVACKYEQIQYFVENLNIPVIGNGDVACIGSLRQMFATGCVGVMIGRAGVGQPWLIGQLAAQMKGEAFAIPSNNLIGKLFITHVEELAHLLHSERFAIIQARKFAKYYARTILNKSAFCEAINACDSLDVLADICNTYF